MKQIPILIALRKAAQIMLIGILSLLALLLIFIGVLFVLSPGKPDPVVDEKGNHVVGSISEKIRVPINGIDQGMVIQSKNLSNPVLLFVHGGPGMPEFWLTERYPTGLEQDFTVVWWEQRGAGLSFQGDMATDNLSYEQLISDTLAVTNYLRSRFGKEKIYLMAHSGGSFVAIQAATRAPELFHAYIGVAQMVYGLESEHRAYEYMLKEYKALGNRRMVERLEAAPPGMTAPLAPAYDALRDDAMHTLGVGTTRKMNSVITGIFFPSWFSRVYTLPEKVNLWRGKIFSKKQLWEHIIATDLRSQIGEIGLPVYFFHGKFDYTCSYTLAKSYAESLKAPLKGFYTFEESAHSPMFEEPEKVRQILREDVLAGLNQLADKR